MEALLLYFQKIGIALSVLINVILGGYSNQTFSARNYERKRLGRWNLVWIIDKLFFLSQDHCMHSWSYWFTRKDVEK